MADDSGSNEFGRSIVARMDQRILQPSDTKVPSDCVFNVLVLGMLHQLLARSNRQLIMGHVTIIRTRRISNRLPRQRQIPGDTHAERHTRIRLLDRFSSEVVKKK
jgi:hypothetical protein